MGLGQELIESWSSILVVPSSNEISSSRASSLLLRLALTLDPGEFSDPDLDMVTTTANPASETPCLQRNPVQRNTLLEAHTNKSIDNLLQLTACCSAFRVMLRRQGPHEELDVTDKGLEDVFVHCKGWRRIPKGHGLLRRWCSITQLPPPSCPSAVFFLRLCHSAILV